MIFTLKASPLQTNANPQWGRSLRNIPLLHSSLSTLHSPRALGPHYRQNAADAIDAMRCGGTDSDRVSSSPIGDREGFRQRQRYYSSVERGKCWVSPGSLGAMDGWVGRGLDYLIPRPRHYVRSSDRARLCVLCTSTSETRARPILQALMGG